MNDNEIIEMLLEGGNARYIDRNTNEIAGFADKMDLEKLPRKILVDEMVIVLQEINNLFNKKFGEKLWNNFNVITSGKALNGSSSSLFNKDISDEEFVAHKPKVGDIDITFPGQHMGKLWELLNTIDGKKLSPMVKYLGHKNSNMNPAGAAAQHQINAIFEIDAGNYKINAQIDFESSEYENDSPTDWASFSHNSDWSDIKAGFKGVAHKFVLLNLARAQSKMEGISVVTPTVASKISLLTKEEYEAGKPIKVSTSQKYDNPTNLAFSVAKGIRTKFTPVFFKDGKEQLIIDGKPVFVEKDSKNDKYTTQLEKQFEMIFQSKPSNTDMSDFNSFVGLVKLMKKYSTKETIEDFFFNQLVSKTLYCSSGCQGLERNNPEGDFAIKSAIVNYLYENFSYLKSYKQKVDDASEEYYKGYKMMEISEGFIPYGSKLSTIFETVSKINENKDTNFIDKKRALLLDKGIDKKEVETALRHPELHHNSIAMNDIIRKNKFTREEEQFLRKPIEIETGWKKQINNNFRGKF